MIGAFTLLLVYQLIGELLVYLTGLPVPGPVVGMLLLFVTLVARGALNALGIHDHAVRGCAVGVAAHGIGTARASQVSEIMGAFAGLAKGLNGLLTAFLFPLLLKLWGG
ncbi:MAG TPA: LrgB family protein [Burkholderiales bacterium]|nr:LrgB family protein [Burkholderiales bacterium]